MGELRSRRARPRRDRRQLRARQRRSTTCSRTLRERYPNLLIENVSGGGNRLDFGMLRYTDAAWMDDRTAPSVHVRHNLEGLSAGVSAGLPAVVRHRSRHRAAARRAGSVALLPQPDGRRARPVLPQRSFDRAPRAPAWRARSRSTRRVRPTISARRRSRCCTAGGARGRGWAAVGRPAVEHRGPRPDRAVDATQSDEGVAKINIRADRPAAGHHLRCRNQSTPGCSAAQPARR